ncbi:MAG: DNA translocase FtsK, partial [Bacteroidetes bacterium]|nr:DNA translocase FtsK [Bacteroidota bacterium]
PSKPETDDSSDLTFTGIGNEVAFEVAESPKSYDDEISEKADKLVEDFGEFDPTLELPNYKPPHLDLLEDHGASVNQISVDKEELSANKDRIVETLNNYNIAIDRITATVGPTVTLYEIVPQAGVRISKIKNLEDDIALSLSALGIRIIAPIPGKGTIGIEVPNKNPSVVSMRSVMASKKFSAANNYDLPIAFGKTIANETFVVDLAKMPHMLMAGATGQGKSVGLNAVITSLLYKKHPAELKFVLVDPKKVELTLYNKIERHFLAKLPGSDEAIITDTKKVINTLNSLCIEMDDRYDLLKNAMVRNIKEYNAKFIKRKLNPNEGHRYLPYIVLVIDEFADLIMTAGKEVETPIARLAQLARAIGIHLIIATQRPSVNVITGIIKANFPARLAFRVTSKIDSRTILDSSGADQLIGRGDMLYTQGSELVRLQCAFVDTPEVEEITSYIGSQRAYASAHLLPEYEDDSSESSLVDDINERDPLFKEAAEIVVQSQQGSTSLIQRKMKIGYNRAGRIIDQLEAAGIVGPFEGSKARQVLFKDVISLQQFFDNQTQ